VVRKQSDATVCPRCGSGFAISKHRRYKIENRYAPFWFFDAIRQFEHHDEVICPECRHQYKAEEARLFFCFRSPYVVLALCLILGLISVLVALKLAGKF
jgi:ssDNA-binding Zn-finger/Zn-ribbon topoisomerase 1